ncbi:MAG: hypothetical protein E7064_00850 [Spirochaetaceae bacterium]|nr:hypothetical protein [Spirochaetaceae bacterium]
MNKLCIFFLLFCCFLFACNNNPVDEYLIEDEPNDKISEDNDNEENNSYVSKVIFKNNTQFYVTVFKDAFSGVELAQIKPGETDCVEVSSSDNYGVGSTFCVKYKFKVTDENYLYSGDVFADVFDKNAQINFVIEKGKTYTKEIPLPKDFECKSLFLRIKNKATSQFELTNLGVSYKQVGNEELPVPINKTGIYRFDTNKNFSDFKFVSVFNKVTAPDINLECGYIYDFVFTNEDETSYIIFDKKQKIKSVPTTKYLQTVVENQNELIKDTDLNNFLNTDLRLSLSDYHYQYPISKVIVDNEKYISASSGFSFFDSDSFEQVVDRGKPKEVALLISKDFAWQTEKFSLQSLYAGTETIAYQTIYNDLINVNNDSFVALSTYAKDNRTGMWLYFLNSNGELTNEIDIPSDDTSAYEGYKLLSCSDGGFLSIGRIRNYDSIEEEYSSSSEFIVQKYFNQELQWQTKYSYSDVESEFISNSALCAVELENEYLVCGFTIDDFTTKTLLVKLDKPSGTVITSKSFGTGSDFFSPHAITSDDKQNVYISGLVSETETETKAFILKLDSNLEEIYLKKFGKAADNFLFDLQVKDNSLIAVGAVNTIEEYAFDYYYWQSSKGWILKIDAETGIILNDFYSDKVSCFNSITKTEDDGFVLSAIKNVDKSNPYSFDTLIVKANENLEF